MAWCFALKIQRCLYEELAHDGIVGLAFLGGPISLALNIQGNYLIKRILKGI